mmetsp:Transcript_37689/g.111572  ORF Transcript_37689/g.111572 Transcript_37689/m.111572 type:complete len:280 (+) Transcript_37689:988-1827(+)
MSPPAPAARAGSSQLPRQPASHTDSCNSATATWNHRSRLSCRPGGRPPDAACLPAAARSPLPMSPRGWREATRSADARASGCRATLVSRRSWDGRFQCSQLARATACLPRAARRGLAAGALLTAALARVAARNRRRLCRRTARRAAASASALASCCCCPRRSRAGSHAVGAVMGCASAATWGASGQRAKASWLELKTGSRLRTRTQEFKRGICAFRRDTPLGEQAAGCVWASRSPAVRPCVGRRLLREGGGGQWAMGTSEAFESLLQRQASAPGCCGRA